MSIKLTRRAGFLFLLLIEKYYPNKVKMISKRVMLFEGDSDSEKARGEKGEQVITRVTKDRKVNKVQKFRVQKSYTWEMILILKRL